MKVITNETTIAKRKKIAGIVTPIAMVSLLGGLITNFMGGVGEGANPVYIPVTLALLAIGFIAATVSAHLVNHWVKEPRPDQVLEGALKGFDNRHFLFNYTTPVPHVLLTNHKVYSITPKIINGEISVNQRKWKRKFKFSRLIRFFGEEGLGNPTVEAEQHHQKLTKLIAANLPDHGDIPIEPLIVFTDAEAQLTIQDSVVPVIPGARLKKFLRQNIRDSRGQIDHETYKQLVDILSNGQ